MLAIPLYFSKLPLVFPTMSGLTLLLAASLFSLGMYSFDHLIEFLLPFPSFWDTGTIHLPGTQTWNAIAMQSVKI